MKNIKEKKLSDYLHLYLGCEVESNVIRKRHFVGFVCRDGEPSPTIQDSDEDGHRIGLAYSVPYNDVKLILRPLSDMTEEENDFRWSNFINIKEINQEVVAEEIRWLLSKHFDIFGLIPDLAIDKTTLTP